MELREYTRLLRKRWRLVLLLPTLLVLLASALTLRAVPQYESSVTFFITTPATSDNVSSALTGAQFSAQRVASYTQLVSGLPLARSAAARAGLPVDRVAGRVRAAAEPNTVLLTATVRDTDPRQAQRIAQAYGEAFPQLVADLERPTAGGEASISAKVVTEANQPGGPVSPRPVRNLELALALGLLLGIGLAVARETLDSTVKGPDDLEQLGGVSTLGAITFDSSAVKRPLIVQDAPRAARAEAFRQLRTNLQFVALDHGLRSLVITSSLPAEAKSTTACNLAITQSQAGKRVLLVEGDLRRPRVADYLGIEGAVGLTSVLIGQVDLEDAIQPWGDNGLHVLPSGPLPPNPAELLASDGMRLLLSRLEGRYDAVIIDAPPLLPVTDAAVLGAMCSGVLLCVRVSKTKRDQLSRALTNLRSVDATIVGALLTMVPRRGPDSYYGYGYGYGGYAQDTLRPRLDAQEASEATRRTAPVSAAGSTQVVMTTDAS